MTETPEDLLANINLNKILIAILEQVKEIRIPTEVMLDAGNSDKELILMYEEEPPSFVISLRDKQDGNAN